MCGCSAKPGLRSGYSLQGVKEKFDLARYSERSSGSKMVASIGGCHLQSKEQFSLVAQAAILEEPFCLHSEVGDDSEVPPRQTMNANWAKKHRQVEPYPERSPDQLNWTS